MRIFELFIFRILFFASVTAAPSIDAEECELHAPNSMHDFCCALHFEDVQYMDCQIEWHNKLRTSNDEREMIVNFCISECVYNKTEYLAADRLSLSLKVIHQHMEEMHGDEESVKLMSEIYEKCGKHAKDMLTHIAVKRLKNRVGIYNCHPYSGLVFECVSNELTLNCPPKKFSKTAQCEHARQYLNTCLKHKKLE